MGLLPRFVTWFVDEKYDSYCATFPPPEAYPVKVLVITCSPMKEASASIEMVNYFLSEYKKVRPQDVVEVLDLTAGELPPFSAAHAAVKYRTWGSSKEPPVELKDDWEYTTALIERLITYDKFIFGVSMWNMTIPHTLKLFFDHIIQPHLTFNPREGTGLVLEKPALIISASGNCMLGTDNDLLTPHMNGMLDTIGFTDIRHVHINGTADVESRAEALTAARSELAHLAPDWEFDPSRTAPLHEAYTPMPPPSKPSANGNKVLFIKSSPMGTMSVSTKVAQAFLDGYKMYYPEAEVAELDLWERNLPPFTAARVQARNAAFYSEVDADLVEAQEASEWSEVEAIVAQFKEADTYVFATPMWNLGIPWELKKYFDYLVQPAATFSVKQLLCGQPGGLITGRPCYIFCSDGDGFLGTEKDYVSKYFSAILPWIGLNDLRFFHISGTTQAHDPEQYIADKCSEAMKLLQRYAGHSEID